MMKRKLMWILAFLPLIMVLAVYRFLPQSVPLHFDIEGRANGWGSRFSLILLSLLSFVMALAAEIYLRYKKKKSTDEKQAASTKTIESTLLSSCIILNLFFTMLIGVMLHLSYRSAESMDECLPISAIICATVAVLLILLGNILPKTRRNSFIGVRCTWTQFNDITWAKSNRFCGASMMIVGVLELIFVCFLPKFEALILIIVLSIAGMSATLVYARKIYLEEKQK